MPTRLAQKAQFRANLYIPDSRFFTLNSLLPPQPHVSRSSLPQNALLSSVSLSLSLSRAEQGARRPMRPLPSWCPLPVARTGRRWPRARWWWPCTGGARWWWLGHGRVVVAARVRARAPSPSGERIAAVQIDDEVCPSLSLLPFFI